MAYELIAFDMDGTLLDSHKEVLRSSVDAISEAVAAGKHVAIASGRCPRMVSMYRESIPGVRYAICCAGAIVFDLAASRVLSEVDIAPEVVARAIHTADEEGDYVLEVTTGLGIAMERRGIEMAPQCGVGVYKQLYLDTSDIVEDAHAVALDPTARIPKLNFHFVDAAARDRTFERLADADVTITRCEVSSIEFTCPGVDKGTGLASLASKLGLDISQAIAVGDADNDLAMLRAAGLGVAMGNASEEVQSCADEVTQTNDEDGVAQMIERVLGL